MRRLCTIFDELSFIVFTKYNNFLFDPPSKKFHRRTDAKYTYLLVSSKENSKEKYNWQNLAEAHRFY